MPRHGAVPDNGESKACEFAIILFCFLANGFTLGCNRPGQKLALRGVPGEGVDES